MFLGGNRDGDANGRHGIATRDFETATFIAKQHWCVSFSSKTVIITIIIVVVVVVVVVVVIVVVVVVVVVNSINSIEITIVIIMIVITESI